MKSLAWLLAIGSIVAVAWGWLRLRRRAEERRQAEAARAASFLAQAVARPAATAATPAPEERLLADAAAKAGEAGEPALAIQLYARLVARFPQGALAAQAKLAVEAQKKKLATARSPGTAGRD
ncbi:MAG TPA: hypothetical protein VG873_07440 [Burkholderiales bacterium]|nr:hypothetical protein [Burkholderiales bacterium]